MSCELDSSVRNALCGHCEQLTTKQRSVKAQEREMYEVYKCEETKILNLKKKTQEELTEEQRRLDADEIYLAECGEKLRLATGREMDEDRRYIEEAGLEKEHVCVKENKNRLLVKRAEMDATFKTAMSELQDMRTQQIETLNETRDDVKVLTNNFNVLVEERIAKNRETFADTQLAIEVEETLLADVSTKCDAAKLKWNDERAVLEKESDWLNDVMCKWRRHSEQAESEIARRTTGVEEESSHDLTRITNHRKM